MRGRYRLVYDHEGPAHYIVERWHNPGWRIEEVFCTRFFARWYIRRQLRKGRPVPRPREVLEVFE